VKLGMFDDRDPVYGQGHTINILKEAVALKNHFISFRSGKNAM